MKKFYSLLGAMALLSSGVSHATLFDYYHTLDLSKNVVPEELTFTDGDYWAGTYSEDVQWLQFGNFLVSHTLGSSWGGTYWDGFTVSRSSDTLDHSDTDDGGWYTHQWSSIAGGGIKGEYHDNVWRDGAQAVLDSDGKAVVDPEAPYLVANWGYYDGAPQQTNQIMLANGLPFEPIDAYITGSTWAYYSNIHGYYPARAFAEGDVMYVTAHGVHSDGSETTLDFNLAWHDGELHQVDKWERWDLTSLGYVHSLYFTVHSTDVGDWGMNTPAYFCLDKLHVEGIISNAVNDVNSESPVTSVTYVNAAGQTSTQPFEGMNIVVTRHADGTTTSTKVIK